MTEQDKKEILNILKALDDIADEVGLYSTCENQEPDILAERIRWAAFDIKKMVEESH